MSPLIAHGGAAGLAIEMLLALVLVGGPILALVAFARWQRRQEGAPEGGDSRRSSTPG